jgi:RPA family protein
MTGRETAWRVFAGEFRESTHGYQDEGDRSPNYVVSPLGARMNRVFAVGVLTSTETVGEEGDLLRGQLTDPTGVFYLYAGQYSPEAANALEELQPPTVVAVVGKARTYEPEEGEIYTSVRPEVLREVEVDSRDRWILETARHTRDRLLAVRDAAENGVEALEGHDLPPALEDGIERALDHYGEPSLERYADMTKDAAESLLPGETELRRDFAPASDWDGDEDEAPDGPDARDEDEPEVEEDEADESTEIEDAVYGFVENLDDGDGAPWDEIVDAADEEDITEEQVEEALNSLMDRGLIYEPVLGRLKPT